MDLHHQMNFLEEKLSLTKDEEIYNKLPSTLSDEIKEKLSASINGAKNSNLGNQTQDQYLALTSVYFALYSNDKNTSKAIGQVLYEIGDMRFLKAVHHYYTQLAGGVQSRMLDTYWDGIGDWRG